MFYFPPSFPAILFLSLHFFLVYCIFARLISHAVRAAKLLLAGGAGEDIGCAEVLLLLLSLLLFFFLLFFFTF